MKTLPSIAISVLHPRGRAGVAMLALLSFIVLPGMVPAAAQQCSAAGGGPPCQSATGVASLGDPDGADVSVGNPIDPITGNKYQEEVDAPMLPGFLGLEIRRHFNSRYASADSPWGKGWSMSYDTRVHRSGATLQIVQADGRRLIFAAPPDAATRSGAPAAVTCTSAAPGQGQLFVEPYGYRWVWPQQRELHFDHAGNLTRVGPRGAEPVEAVTIERGNEGRILSVTDPAGRAMRFQYDSHGYLESIDHPLGRWRYRIDAGGHVQSVTAPDQVVRGYRYEDQEHPARFTAITVAAPGTAVQVVGEWSYDAQGRAERYRRGDGTELRLAYQQMQPGPGQGEPTHQRTTTATDPSSPETVSVLTNALGARTYFKAVEVNGKWRVTEILGSGCDECGPSNIRMRYDAQGQLLARATIGGGGMTYLRDRFGRVVLVSPLPRWEDQDPRIRPGKTAGAALPQTMAGPARGGDGQSSATYLQRFEYADDDTFLPRLIARPSVIPGLEHRLVVERDDRGNVVALVQSGYAPGAAQEAGSTPLRMERTWRLRYQQIGGRRVLAEVDGPLPNGPAADPSDSDITRFRHDPEGRFLVAEELPGPSLQGYVSRDGAWRPLVIESSDGQRQSEERLIYNLRGQVVRSESSARFADVRRAGDSMASVAPLRTTFDYDLQGRLVQRVDPAGRATHHHHDAAGRSSGVADGRGYRTSLLRDAEGRVRVAALHEPGSEVPLRASYYGRGPDGRLESLLLADGRQYGLHYDADGRPAGFSGGPGFSYPMTAAGKPSAGSSDEVDDFGQLLRQVLPDHGETRWRYDAAGRVVERVDAAGVRTDYRYDTADRLITRSVTGSAAEVTFAYEGSWLVAVEDPAQTIRYRRDARGRVVETTTLLHGLAGPPLKVSMAHDPATGLVQAHGLAGGQSLHVRRRSAAEGATPRHLDLRSAFWTRTLELAGKWLPPEWVVRLDGLVPRTRVAGEIKVHAFDGLTGFVHHNGIALTRQFDPVGRTARLVSGSSLETVSHWRYTYGVGPRIRSIEQLDKANARGANASRRQSFDYHAAGGLRSVVEEAPGQAPVRREPSSLDHSGADRIIQRDKAGRVVADSRFRYSYSSSGQLEAVHERLHDRRVASYAYNYRGQRVRKTVFQEGGTASSTRYYLWHEQRLVAEIDPDGTIVTQYLSLDDGHRHLPIARLRRARGFGGGFELLALHADHRGAPVAMTDARRQVVWRADVAVSGLADVHQRPRQLELNLRLPGQYWDHETGLHDNWHRTYDPKVGRYLQPDPLGYPDGPDAYAYAGGDPVNRTDPFGLYEIDVHYYMTFFLGVTAGLDPQEARIVALAAQYVDDNPLTRPVDSTSIGTTVASVLRNQRQLLGYHFVLSGPDGRTLPEYRNSRLTHADSPQLQNLLNAARSSGIGRNASLQFLGEYLHALADTYSHRDAANHPYDALMVNCGVGHGHDLHEPDRTYDDVQPSSRAADEGQPSAGQSWLREARTLEMEAALYGALVGYGRPAAARRFEELESVLREFNAIRESESSGGSKQGRARDFAGKRALLQQQLVRLGYGHFDLRSTELFGYDVERAADNRRSFLPIVSGPQLTEEAYPGVCLEGGSRCRPN